MKDCREEKGVSLLSHDSTWLFPRMLRTPNANGGNHKVLETNGNLHRNTIEWTPYDTIRVPESSGQKFGSLLLFCSLYIGPRAAKMESKNLSLSASMEKEGFLDQLNNFLTKSG